MPKMFGVARDSQGNAVASPTVAVYAAGTTTLASLFSNPGLTVPLANPLTGGTDGTWFAFAAVGTYRIDVSKTGYATYSVDYVTAAGESSTLALADLTDVSAATGSGTVVVLQQGPTINSPTISGGTISSATLSSATISSPTISSPSITGGTIGSPTITTPLIGTIAGGAASGGNLTLQSTQHSTKGKVLFGTSAASVDEANSRVGVGTAAPSYPLDVRGSGVITSFSGSTTESQFHWVSGSQTWLVRLAGATPNFVVRDGTNSTEPFHIIANAPNGSLVVATSGISLFSTTGSFGGGTGVVFVTNRSVAPTSNPSGGGILYAESGAGKWRGSSGTITTFGPAEPHCPKCARDFVLEWESPVYGHLCVCLWCLTDALAALGIDPGVFRKESGSAPR